jgi:hypothetical protein
MRVRTRVVDRLGAAGFISPYMSVEELGRIARCGASSPRTASKPQSGLPSQGGKSFLRTHAAAIASMGMFVSGASRA